MQIRPTAFTIGLIIHFSIALFCVYTEFGIDSFLGIHLKYTFRAPFPGTKIEIEESKRKKSE